MAPDINVFDIDIDEGQGHTALTQKSLQMFCKVMYTLSGNMTN